MMSIPFAFDLRQWKTQTRVTVDGDNIRVALL